MKTSSEKNLLEMDYILTQSTYMKINSMGKKFFWQMPVIEGAINKSLGSQLEMVLT